MEIRSMSVIMAIRIKGINCFYVLSRESYFEVLEDYVDDIRVNFGK